MDVHEVSIVAWPAFVATSVSVVDAQDPGSSCSGLPSLAERALRISTIDVKGLPEWHLGAPCFFDEGGVREVQDGVG
jgi:hypothetical protein